MSLYIDRKYLMFVSARLRNFKQKTDDSWNFSCPFCGDSSRNRLKARGYMFKAKDFNGMAYHCHNCNISTNFSNFLKHLDPQKYKEYIMETFKDKPLIETKPKPEFELKDALLTFKDIKIPSIAQLPPGHYAREYIESRRIPKVYHDEIFFAMDFKQFLDETFPDHGKDKLPEKDPRIVLFYTNIRGDITNVSGRSFGADPKLRYITVKVSEERKLYGLHRLDLKQPVFVTEGQFDSLFLDNAVAAGDSALSAAAYWLYDTFGVNPVVIFDNEPRNPEIVKGLEKAIKEKCQVVIWPENLGPKDINDMVELGWPVPDIRQIIKDNTYNDLTAVLKLTAWRKC